MTANEKAWEAVRFEEGQLSPPGVASPITYSTSTMRYKVQGGWIYREIVAVFNKGCQQSVSTVFVPHGKKK